MSEPPIERVQSEERRQGQRSPKITCSEASAKEAREEQAGREGGSVWTRKHRQCFRQGRGAQREVLGEPRTCRVSVGLSHTEGRGAGLLQWTQSWGMRNGKQ